MSYKKLILERFLSNKSNDYVIQEGESELINLLDDVIQGLQEDLKYSNDQKKRLLNEKLNLEERVDELLEQIKDLQKTIKELKY